MRGYDKKGYNKKGYDRKGYKKKSYDKYGYNEDGCDENGYDEDQMNKNKHLKKIKKKIKKESHVDLSNKEMKQLAEYIYLFKKYDCYEHWEVNKIINKKKKWGEFKKLRSKNNHGYTYNIKGIQPKFFRIVCRVLDIRGDNGNPLIDYESY